MMQPINSKEKISSCSLSELSVNDLLEAQIHCQCGQIHATTLKKLVIEPDALKHLPNLLKDGNYQKPFFIADHNTMAACGTYIQTLLNERLIPHIFFELPMDDILPDEVRCGSILMAFDRSCDVIVAVGSGTINDLSRFVSYRLGLPYFVIATAPSMDGYVSNVAAMTTNQMKTTYPARIPQYVLGDLNLLRQAPYDLLTAGFGDIMGKYTCIMDWRLSHLVNQEYYCDDIASLIIKARDLTLLSKDGLIQRTPESIEYLLQALVLSGIGMSFAGNSRPASGSEHHLSHFWEMRYLFEGRKPILHGTKVAIGTIVSLKLYELLGTRILDPSKMVDYHYDSDVWRSEMERVYLNAAPEVIKLEEETRKNQKEQRDLRMKSVCLHWNEILTLIHTLPSADQMIEILKEIRAPYHPSEIGLTRELVYEGICYAKEVRNRYTILQLLWDLGVIHEFAQETVEYLFKEL